MEKSNSNKILKLEKAYKYFGGVKAVNNCSFEIIDGQITALIGPNGSGKSTVFNLISGNLNLDLGKIFFDKTDISNIRIDKRARLGISRLYQHSRLFSNMSVRENLTLAIEQKDFRFIPNTKNDNLNSAIIENALSELGISALIDKRSKDLSYGQKRIVEIVRTYLLPHKIMLLDEPIAGVAPHLRILISDFLKKLRDKGETILIVEHDMNFIKNLVNQVIVMDAGKVIAEGIPNTILNQKNVIEAYLG